MKSVFSGLKNHLKCWHFCALVWLLAFLAPFLPFSTDFISVTGAWFLPVQCGDSTRLQGFASLGSALHLGAGC